MSFAFFFPGQGSQKLNMMSGFENLDSVKQTFATASAVLNVDLWALINGDDATIINKTTITQPLMLAAGIATYRVYLARGGVAPTMLAGHSLGEYTALVAAESIDYKDAIGLVSLRAQLMQNAVPEDQGAMAVILGLSDEKVREVCAQVAAQSQAIVEAVNYNSVNQVVIAGEIAAVELAMQFAKEAGAIRAMLLPVSVPSHCSLMQPAAEKLKIALDKITLQPPKIKVIQNADVRAYDDVIQIKDALVRQLYSPVRWTETVLDIQQRGITTTAECGPGKVLAGLVKRISKEMKCSSFLSVADIDQWISENN